MPVYTYTTLDDPLAVMGTFAQGINNSGQIVGSYVNNGGHGFLLSGGTYITLDDPVATQSTSAQGINSAGQIVGYYGDSNFISHGFLYNPTGGTYTTPNDPPATNGTPALRLNDSARILGGWHHTNADHALILAPGPRRPAARHA